VRVEVKREEPAKGSVVSRLPDQSFFVAMKKCPYEIHGQDPLAMRGMCDWLQKVSRIED
jgi:hypothetical protein